jgi:methionyl-tRNA formyltransferase
VFTLVCFGLPLAPYLLTRDGHQVSLAVLSPVPAPGRRRLRGQLGQERVLDALDAGAELEAQVDDALRANPPDLIVSWFWTRRLPERWLERSRLGAIGAHPSLLPKYRGPNPYFGAIDAGERTTGVTIHRLTPRYDDGEILLQGAIEIGERDSWQLARALDRPSLSLLREAVRRLSLGELATGTPQDEAQAIWSPEPDGDALSVDWRWPTERVLSRIRALAPLPGLVLDIEALRLLVVRARASAEFPRALEPGEGAVVGQPPVFVLRTGDGAIALERATLEDETEQGTLLSASDLARTVQEHLAGRRARVQ